MPRTHQDTREQWPTRFHHPRGKSATFGVTAAPRICELLDCAPRKVQIASIRVCQAPGSQAEYVSCAPKVGSRGRWKHVHMCAPASRQLSGFTVLSLSLPILGARLTD